MANATGSYLNTLMTDFVMTKVLGNATDLICRVNPNFRKKVTMEGRNKVLYMRLYKALYRCMQSVLFWYQIFLGKLRSMGFHSNKYGPCDASKIINESQCTVA